MKCRATAKTKAFQYWVCWVPTQEFSCKITGTKNISTKIDCVATATTTTTAEVSPPILLFYRPDFQFSSLYDRWSSKENSEWNTKHHEIKRRCNKHRVSKERKQKSAMSTATAAPTIDFTTKFTASIELFIDLNQKLIVLCKTVFLKQSAMWLPTSKYEWIFWSLWWCYTSI